MRSRIAWATGSAVVALLGAACAGTEREPDGPGPSSPRSISVPTGEGNGDVTGTFGDVDLAGDWVVTCFDRSDGAVQVSARGRGEGLQAVRGLVRDDRVTGVSIAFGGETGTNREGTDVVLRRNPDGWSLSGELTVGTGSDETTRPFAARVECRAPVR